MKLTAALNFGHVQSDAKKDARKFKNKAASLRTYYVPSTMYSVLHFSNGNVMRILVLA